MGKLTWECYGAEIVLSDDEKATIFCDVDNLPCTVTGTFDRRSAPGMQGTNTYSAALSGMQIAISGTVMARNMGSKSRPVDLVLEDYRKLLCSVFNPLFSGKLTRNMMGGLYFVEARANSTPIFDTVFGGTLPFSVDLYADEPYWKLDDKRIIDIGPSETETVFPGETQEDFEELYRFVNEMEFDRLGVFPYSQEEDTPAATMEDQVPQEVKEFRRDELLELQQAIAFDKAEDMVGHKLGEFVPTRTYRGHGKDEKKSRR